MSSKLKKAPRKGAPAAKTAVSQVPELKELLRDPRVVRYLKALQAGKVELPPNPLEFDAAQRFCQKVQQMEALAKQIQQEKTLLLQHQQDLSMLVGEVDGYVALLAAAYWRRLPPMTEMDLEALRKSLGAQRVDMVDTHGDPITEEKKENRR